MIGRGLSPPDRISRCCRLHRTGSCSAMALGGQKRKRSTSDSQKPPSLRSALALARYVFSRSGSRSGCMSNTSYLFTYIKRSGHLSVPDGSRHRPGSVSPPTGGSATRQRPGRRRRPTAPPVTRPSRRSVPGRRRRTWCTRPRYRNGHRFGGGEQWLSPRRVSLLRPRH